MANFVNIARPYAQAAFDYARDQYARDHDALLAWKRFLDSAATLARYPDIVKWLANPELATAKITELFHELLAPYLDEKRNNFLLLLALHKRLVVLPEIAELFNKHYAALEKMSTVRVITAVQANDEFRQLLTSALKKRLQHDVTLNCHVDPAIIGGAIIHIGDKVIDGSIRGKLSRLLQSLAG